MREKEALPDMLRRMVKPAFVLLDGAEQLSPAIGSPSAPRREWPRASW